MLMPQFPSGWAIHLIRDVLHIINRQRRPLFFTRAQWKLVFHLGRKWKSRLGPPEDWYAISSSHYTPSLRDLGRKLHFSPNRPCCARYRFEKSARHIGSTSASEWERWFLRVSTIMITTWSCNWPSSLILFNPYQNKRLYWPAALAARLTLEYYYPISNRVKHHAPLPQPNWFFMPVLTFIWWTLNRLVRKPFPLLQPEGSIYSRVVFTREMFIIIPQTTLTDLLKPGVVKESSFCAQKTLKELNKKKIKVSINFLHLSRRICPNLATNK